MPTPGLWGGNLKGVADAPVLLDVTNRAVYSAHDYPASISRQTWFEDSSYPANLPRLWDEFWGFIARNQTAPVLMGEFGSKLDSESDRKWLDSLVTYLGTNGIHWVYWSLNPNSADTGGLLLDDWSTVDERKIAKLKPIQTVPFSGTDDKSVKPPTPASPSPSIPATPPADTQFCGTKYRVFSDWATGFSADLLVTNLGAGPIDGWTLSWQFTGNEMVRDLWNGRFTQTGGQLRVTDVGWNATFPLKTTIRLGCRRTTGAAASVPSDIRLNGFPCVNLQ